MINHIRRWNIWRKHNTNGPLHILLVLLGLRWSPTLILTFLPEENQRLADAINNGFHGRITDEC